MRLRGGYVKELGCHFSYTAILSHECRVTLLRPTQPEPDLCGRLEWVPSKSWGNKQAYRVIHQPVTVVSQCGAGAWLYGWLADISADLREAVAHLRRVRDDALNKSTVSLLYDSHSKLATNSQPPRIVVVLYV